MGLIPTCFSREGSGYMNCARMGKEGMKIRILGLFVEMITCWSFRPSVFLWKVQDLSITLFILVLFFFGTVHLFVWSDIRISWLLGAFGALAGEQVVFSKVLLSGVPRLVLLASVKVAGIDGITYCSILPSFHLVNDFGTEIILEPK